MRGKLVAVCLGLAASACLPKDTRPPPGQLLVTATPSDAIVQGIGAGKTLDGWDIVFDRFLISLGRTDIGNDCVGYADGRYSRILEMRQPGPQKVSIIYALGACDFGFEVSNPRVDAVLSTGVTHEDLLFMATPGSDPWVKKRGVTLFVQGSAQKAASTKHFAWAFRQRIKYTNCRSNAGEKGIHFASGADDVVDLAVHGETLFQEPVIGAGQLGVEPNLSFQRFADADDVYGNQDGEVTLDELRLVPLDMSGVDGGLDAGIPDASLPDGDADAEAGETKVWTNFGDYVYLGLVRQVVRYRENGLCSVEQSNASETD